MENNKRLDAIFFALSDSRRREILEELSEGKKSVGQLAAHFEQSLSAISKNIKLLETADLIHKSKQGRTVYCHMNYDIWKEVTNYIAMHAKFWGNRLMELEDFINNQDKS